MMEANHDIAGLTIAFNKFGRAIGSVLLRDPEVLLPLFLLSFSSLYLFFLLILMIGAIQQPRYISTLGCVG